MRLKTLQNSTAEEVNSTVCHWRGGLKAGDTLARWAAWQLGVPMPCMPSHGVSGGPADPQATKQHLHDDGCSRGPVPSPQQMNQRPEQPLGLGHDACITLQTCPMLVSFCLLLMPSCSPCCRSQPSWTPWR